LYYLPQFFQVALGYDPLHAGMYQVLSHNKPDRISGLFLIPLLVVQIVASWVAVRSYLV
jgi:hypothetical protein